MDLEIQQRIKEEITILDLRGYLVIGQVAEIDEDRQGDLIYHSLEGSKRYSMASLELRVQWIP